MYLDFAILCLVYTCWIPALRSSHIWSRPICFSPWGFWLLFDDIVSNILKSSSVAILMQGTANSPLDENIQYHSKFIHSSSERMSFKCREWNLIAGKPKEEIKQINGFFLDILGWVLGCLPTDRNIQSVGISGYGPRSSRDYFPFSVETNSYDLRTEIRLLRDLVWTHMKSAHKKSGVKLRISTTNTVFLCCLKVSKLQLYHLTHITITKINPKEKSQRKLPERETQIPKK